MRYVQSSASQASFSRIAPLTIHKVSGTTGAALAGAVFELRGDGGFVCRGATDGGGLLCFCLAPCRSYTLREISPPPGYAPLERSFHICVDACGVVHVDGRPATEITVTNTVISASFTAVKVHAETGAPLAGALYTLLRDGLPVKFTYSTEQGGVTFTELSPGAYDLIETSPPAGFQPNPTKLAVVVGTDGTVTIEGQPANGFRLPNVPIMALRFRKVEASTGLPVAGAGFQLSWNGTWIVTAVSDPEGMVDFGYIAPGVYTLVETVTPPGYLPNEHVYRVVIEANGSIAIDGVPIGSFLVGNVRLPDFAANAVNTAAALTPQGGCCRRVRCR